MIRIILSGDVDPLYVVLGHSGKDIQSAIIEKNIRVIHNPDWEKGISSSIRAGISALPIENEAVIIFIVDQPFLSSDLISGFITQYHSANPDILVTRVKNQYCHPVLFSRKYYSDLLKLEGDEGGKEIFTRENNNFFEWEDDKLMLDIDTEDDFGKIKKLAAQS